MRFIYFELDRLEWVFFFFFTISIFWMVNIDYHLPWLDWIDVFKVRAVSPWPCTADLAVVWPDWEGRTGMAAVGRHCILQVGGTAGITPEQWHKQCHSPANPSLFISYQPTHLGASLVTPVSSPESSHGQTWGQDFIQRAGFTEWLQFCKTVGINKKKPEDSINSFESRTDP